MRAGCRDRCRSACAGAAGRATRGWLAAALLLGSFTAGNANAIVIYDFEGVCSPIFSPETDCSGTATAVLILDGYMPGTPLSPANFVRLEYESSNLDFVNTSADFLTGVLPVTPGPADFFTAQFGSQALTTFSTGLWDAAAIPRGLSHTWTLRAIPEPHALALFAVGLLGLALSCAKTRGPTTRRAG
jgi:hypothetical protein